MDDPEVNKYVYVKCLCKKYFIIKYLIYDIVPEAVKKHSWNKFVILTKLSNHSVMQKIVSKNPVLKIAWNCNYGDYEQCFVLWFSGRDFKQTIEYKGSV